MKMISKKLHVSLAFIAVFFWVFPVFAVELNLHAKAAMLVECETGRVLYKDNIHKRMAPASMAKIMTILITMESIDKGTITMDDTVTVSAAASNIGGSQVYLKHNERITVDSLVRSMIVASANDAAYCLAEYIAGSEESFVWLMNEHAEELGLENTFYSSSHGLPAGTTRKHDYTTAEDLKKLALVVIKKYPQVLQWTSMGTDTIRDGAFVLKNTNKLIGKYRGMDGLKTGYTKEAGFGIVCTAQRDGLRLVSVVMGCATNKLRFSDSQTLLDWGFSTYKKQQYCTQDVMYTGQVVSGVSETVLGRTEHPVWLVLSAQEKQKIQTVFVPEKIVAPVKSGDRIGRVKVMLGTDKLAQVPVNAIEAVAEKKGFWQRLFRM